MPVILHFRFENIVASPGELSEDAMLYFSDVEDIRIGGMIQLEVIICNKSCWKPLCHGKNVSVCQYN